MGYATLGDFAEQELGVSLSTLLRLRKLGRAFALHPDLQPAVARGLDLDVACTIGQLSWNRREARQWIELAASMSPKSVQAVARATSFDGRAARRCEEAIAAAPAYAAAAAAALVGGPALPAPTSPAPAAPSPDASESGQPPKRPLQVAFTGLEEQRFEPIRRGWCWVRVGLIEAARWLLDTVPLPKPASFSSKVKAAQGHRCQNPECGRLALALDAHHLHFRSLGGQDTPDNAIALCRSCHLRLVHSGRVKVIRVGEAIVWTWPDRQTVVFPWDRPVDG